MKRERGLERQRERGLFDRDPVNVHPVETFKYACGAGIVGVRVRAVAISRRGDKDTQGPALAGVAAPDILDQILWVDPDRGEDLIERFHRNRDCILELGEDFVVTIFHEPLFKGDLVGFGLGAFGDLRHCIALGGRTTQGLGHQCQRRAKVGAGMALRTVECRVFLRGQLPDSGVAFVHRRAQGRLDQGRSRFPARADALQRPEVPDCIRDTCSSATVKRCCAAAASVAR